MPDSRGKRADRPWEGASVLYCRLRPDDAVRQPAAIAAGINTASRATIIAVGPGSLAARAGIALGDIVVALDGELVKGVDDLIQLLTAERIGRESRSRC